jgi:mannitol/fructose-specific phosphotransferase system IIA component (Ntr-type)
MNPVVNHLIQLQELILIRDEQKISVAGTGGRSEHLEQLDESIGMMSAKLPDDVRGLFEKLHKKDHTVIVPVSNGNCAGCGLMLPISLVQQVRHVKEVHYCPNCARMLFYPEMAVRSVAKKESRLAPRKVGILRFSAASLMLPRLASDTFEGALGELAKSMEQSGFVERADILVESALRREAIITTIVDHGLAFPHVRGVEGGGLVLALGISRDGVKSPHGNGTAKIIFFLVIPTAASAFYLKLLAGLTETFRKEEARKALMAEKEPEALWKSLMKLTRATIK